LKKCVGLRVSC